MARLMKTAGDEVVSTHTHESPESFRFMGRQPILDGAGKIFGHELLFRSGTDNAFSGDAEYATRDVIDHYLLLMSNSSDHLAFVNCTRNALTSGIVTLLPATRVVLELLEDIDPDPELLECCMELRRSGYRFALDDFSPSESKLPFLEIADFIKIDFIASDAATRKQIYEMAAHRKVVFIAEKVETICQVQTAKDEGCELFQGYFFSKPVIVKTKVIPQNSLIYLYLMSTLMKNPVNLLEVEALVAQDASLCYRLLRLVNSVFYALPSPVTSIRSAIMLVGETEFRKLVTVAWASNTPDDGSKALMHLALERAKFCEMLAPLVNESPSRLYLLGMFSLIDALLSVPMTQVMEVLPLDSAIQAALLNKPSPLAPALRLLRARETEDWRRTLEIQMAMGISDCAASKIHVASTQWADRMLSFE